MVRSPGHREPPRGGFDFASHEALEIEELEQHLGLPLGEVLAGKVALIVVSSGGHELLQCGLGSAPEEREYEVWIEGPPLPVEAMRGGQGGQGDVLGAGLGDVLGDVLGSVGRSGLVVYAA